MPSGPISAAATVVPAPPGVFATSMPPELPAASSPISSTEDKDSYSSVDSRCKLSMVNGGNTSVLQPPFSTSRFVIEPDKTLSSPSSKVRKKAKPSRSRLATPNGSPHLVNKPLKVTIRRTADHSHTLDASQRDNKPSPSSVYSSVPGDDEKIPLLSNTLSHGFASETRTRTISPVPDKEKTLLLTPKSVDQIDEGSSKKKNSSNSTADCSTITEPDLLGPCEPGSKIVLEGVVWLETPDMMVVNAHWRGRAYLGTLVDTSKNTLGPSRPDKMISSLSMVKSKPNWGGPVPSTSLNPYRNSVNGSSNTNIPVTSSGTVRTRSAIAAGMGSTSQRRRALHSGASGGRGRKRRRGGMATSLVPSPTEECVDVSGCHSNSKEEVETISAHRPAAGLIPHEFTCPKPGCEKRFSDIRGIRFHLDMSHGQQKAPVSTKDVVIISPGKQHLLEPPQLAKAKYNDRNSFSMGALDDDPPPPQLDRGPSIDEVDSSVIPLCEPPAASPAYSDISDDGPVPPKGRLIPETSGTGCQPNWSSAAPQPKSIAWSGRHEGLGAAKVLPYKYSTTPPQPPPNGLSLNSFGSGGSPYQHHNYRTPVPDPSTSVPVANEKLFQAHLVNLMATGASSPGCPALPSPHRSSRQSSQPMHLFRPQ